MKRWWVRWHGAGAFTLHTPWWCSGYTGDDVPIFVAAILADSAGDAVAMVRAAHDDGTGPETFSFVDERPADWAPFCDRFRRAAWMQWPEVRP